MSKYYNAEDVINTLADQWRFEQEMEYPDTAEDIEEWKKVARTLFSDLPTIDIVHCEDCKRKQIENSDEGTCYFWCDYWQRSIDDTDYCSKGKRKDNE